MRIEYEAFKAGCSGKRNRGEDEEREEGVKEIREEGQKRRSLRARARERTSEEEGASEQSEGGRGAAEVGENGFTRQSLSGRPRENHNARPPSSRRPSSSFCPPVRSSVCLPVHPFVSSSASCHSPRQPSDASRIRNSSPLLSSSGCSFCSFPARRGRRLVIMYCFIAGTLLKFDPVTLAPVGRARRPRCRSLSLSLSQGYSPR